MSHDKIFIRSLGGIGNRMKNLVSGMILAEKEKKELLVEWPINCHLDCNYSDIFLHPKINFIQNTPDNLLSIARDKDSFIFIDNLNVTISNSNSYKEIIISNFNKFIPKTEISDKLIDFESDKQIVGIHYRYDDEWIECRSDLQRMIKNNINFFDLFLQKIYSYNLESTIFFISCSNNIVLDKFKKININKIFYQKTQDSNLNKYKLNRNKVATEEAVLDLYTLAKCDDIIITPQSTFCECAWYLGNCKAKLYNPISQKYL